MEKILEALKNRCAEINLNTNESLIKWRNFHQVTISVITDKPLYNGKIIIQKTSNDEYTVTAGDPKVLAVRVSRDYVVSNINNFCEMLKTHHDNY